MKKIVFLLLLCVIPFMADGQIRRSIDGIEIGKSTKEDVINYANKKGLSYKSLDGGNSISLSEGYKSSVYFAGITWMFVKYRFINNVVYQITYLKPFEINGADECEKQFNSLQKNIIQKYSPNKSRILNSKIYKIKDKKTQIEVERRFKEEYDVLILKYYDLNLASKAKKKIIDDL